MFILNTSIYILFFFLIIFRIINANNTNNPYKILNITSTYITNSELKQKYRKLARKYHPDKYKNSKNDNVDDINAKFLEITNAFEMLNNKERNADTIETLKLDLAYFFSGKNIKYTHNRPLTILSYITKYESHYNTTHGQCGLVFSLLATMQGTLGSFVHGKSNSYVETKKISSCVGKGAFTICYMSNYIRD